MNISVRPATREDAEAIARLEQEFVDYLVKIGDSHPTSLNVETYLRDGFGAEPAFSGLVAENASEVIGYILYHPGYDIDRGGRVFYVLDLFITESARNKGVGGTLMKAVADICRRAGGSELIWAVFLKNRLAMAFYERMGARYLQKENMTYMHWKVNDN